MSSEFFEKIPVAITICDSKGTIIYMNEKSKKVFENDGGEALIGANLYDCHPESTNKIISGLFTENKTNCYTIEKNGIKKLIYQVAWRNKEDKIGGIIEFSLELPPELPHKVRD